MIEIVITGRHDDFGGPDFHDRLCAAAEHNHRLLSAAGIAHRFTLVEWNPIGDRPLLADLVAARLPWWHQSIVVDAEWHPRLSTNPRLEFMEFFAKNAAIRRSDADAILTTNTDVFFSSEVVDALASMTFGDRVVYRATRIDIDRYSAWQTGGEAVFADRAHQLRVNDVQPPTYGNSAGDFLLLTREGWLALGGFNERVRFAKIHKDGQFCVHAHEQGFAFEVLGPIYHIDHDGSYANAGAMRGSPDAPYGPEWDYRSSYRNAASWGLTMGIDEPVAPGRTIVLHPATQGPLLSIIIEPQEKTIYCDSDPDSDCQIVHAKAGPQRTRARNEALAKTRGRFVVVSNDATLTAFGGRDALLETLRSAGHGLVVPAGTLRQHPTLGPVPAAGAPIVFGRNTIDRLIDFDEAESDPDIAFWLKAADRARITEVAGPSRRGNRAMPAIRPDLELKTLTRRGAVLPPSLLTSTLRERLAAGQDLHDVVAQWLHVAVPASTEPCAVVGPDWASGALLDAIHASGRDIVGLFTVSAQEEGTWRWGERMRPLSALAHERVSYVVTAFDDRLAERLAEVGSDATVYAIGVTANQQTPSADAELDALRRRQARDLASGRVGNVLSRLALLSVLEGENRWNHFYNAAQACEAAGRIEEALDLFREVMDECASDLALRMRATFHVARLLTEAGETSHAQPLLACVLAHNPGHGAARRMLAALDDHEEMLTRVTR